MRTRIVGQRERSRLVFQTAKPAERVEEVELVWITTIARRTNAISTKFYMGFMKAAQGLAGHFCVYDTKKFVPRGVDWGRVETDSSNFLAAFVQLAYGT